MKNAILFQTDIETLSLQASNAMIAEIGVHCLVLDENLNVLFQAKESFHLDLAEQEKLGRQMDIDTVQWWLKQDDKARLPLSDNTKRQFALTALTDIKAIVDHAKQIAGENATFTALASAIDLDFTNLQSLAKQVGIALPWHYSEQHSQRTLRYLAPKALRNVELPGENVLHNAADDAERQNLMLLNIMLQGGFAFNALKNFFFHRNDD